MRCAWAVNVKIFWAISSALFSFSFSVSDWANAPFVLLCSLLVVVVGVGSSGGSARSPDLWIMEPSDRERMRVDWTPGFEARRARFSRIAVGLLDGAYVSFCMGLGLFDG